jgi:hypothetical protein
LIALIVDAHPSAEGFEPAVARLARRDRRIREKTSLLRKPSEDVGVDQQGHRNACAPECPRRLTSSVPVSRRGRSDGLPSSR